MNPFHCYAYLRYCLHQSNFVTNHVVDRLVICFRCAKIRLGKIYIRLNKPPCGSKILFLAMKPLDELFYMSYLRVVE